MTWYGFLPNPTLSRKCFYHPPRYLGWVQGSLNAMKAIKCELAPGRRNEPAEMWTCPHGWLRNLFELETPQRTPNTFSAKFALTPCFGSLSYRPENAKIKSRDLTTNEKQMNKFSLFAFLIFFGVINEQTPSQFRRGKHLRSPSNFYRSLPK